MASNLSMSWEDAQAFCIEHSAELVKINSVEENEFVLALARKVAPYLKQVWIGLKWDSSVNRFLWYDHSVPVYKNWAPYEPSGKAAEPCGHMWTGHKGSLNRGTGYWNDLICGVHQDLPCGLVCKKLKLP